MITRTLEEYRHIQTHVIKPEVQAIGQAGQAVTDNLAVTGIVHRIGTDADLIVSIQINITDITTEPTTIHTLVDITHINLGGVLKSFLIALKELVGHKAPDFSDPLTLIIIIQDLVRVIEFCNERAVITKGSLDLISERTAKEFKGISPAKRQFITLCPQVSRILLGLISAIDRRKRLAGCKHILGIADVHFSGEIQTAAEHRQIQTKVILDCLLPSHIGSIRSRKRRIRSRCTAFAKIKPGERMGTERTEIRVIIVIGVLDKCIAQRTVRGTDFQVIHPRTKRLEERLLRNTPTHGTGREHAPAMTFHKTG